MFENIVKFFRGLGRKDKGKESSDTAKERLHLVLVQDRANVSADFLELMKQEIIEVIKKYIDVDERAIDVRLTNQKNDDGTVGAPALYANIPITTIKNEARKANGASAKKENTNIEKLEDVDDEEEPLKEKKQKKSEEQKESSTETKKSKVEKDNTTIEEPKKKTTSSAGTSKKKEIKKGTAKTSTTKTATKSKTKVEAKSRKVKETVKK